MSVEPSELLQRIAATLKADVGPEVTNEFAKTQTFMASVVLEKVAKQLELSPVHARAELDDVDGLIAALDPVLKGGDSDSVESAAVAKALSSLLAERKVAAIGPLVDALYATGGSQLEDALGLIRPVLRRDLDRRMEIAQ